MTSQQFTATVTASAGGRVLFPLPFNPDTVWEPSPATSATQGHKAHS